MNDDVAGTINGMRGSGTQSALVPLAAVVEQISACAGRPIVLAPAKYGTVNPAMPSFKNLKPLAEYGLSDTINQRLFYSNKIDQPDEVRNAATNKSARGAGSGTSTGIVIRNEVTRRHLKDHANMELKPFDGGIPYGADDSTRNPYQDGDDEEAIELCSLRQLIQQLEALQRYSVTDTSAQSASNRGSGNRIVGGLLSRKRCLLPTFLPPTPSSLWKSDNTKMPNRNNDKSSKRLLASEGSGSSQIYTPTATNAEVVEFSNKRAMKLNGNPRAFAKAKADGNNSGNNEVTLLNSYCAATVFVHVHIS